MTFDAAKLTSLVVLAAAVAGPAAAAPARSAAGVVPPTREVTLDDLDIGSMIDPLPWTPEEPGGLQIPDKPGAGWLAIGLEPGDVIVREDGHPVRGNPSIVEGLLELDILRHGKAMVMRYEMRGTATRTGKVDDGAIHDVAHDTDPVVDEVTLKGKPSGVRVVRDLMWFELATGDIVRTIDGAPIHTNSEMLAAVANLRVGANEIVIDRDSMRIVIDVERSAPLDLDTIVRVDATHFTVPHDTLRAIARDSDLASNGVRARMQPTGVAIIEVSAGSLADRAGLVPGDELVQIGDQPATTFDGDLGMELFGAYVHLARKAAAFTMQVKRNGRTVTLSYAITP